MTGPEHSPHVRWVKTYGEIVIMGQYVYNPEDMTDEAAMVLYRRGTRRCFVICMSVAHKYLDSDGYPTQYLVAKATDIADKMGLGATRNASYRVASAIADCFDDFLMMPPRPTLPGDEEPVAEGEVKINGKSFEVELMRH
ncbi:MAG: hypothetical protein V3V08_13160 [Nannocystaceae bacterium]